MERVTFLPINEEIKLQRVLFVLAEVPDKFLDSLKSNSLLTQGLDVMEASRDGSHVGLYTVRRGDLVFYTRDCNLLIYMNDAVRESESREMDKEAFRALVVKILTKHSRLYRELEMDIIPKHFGEFSLQEMRDEIEAMLYEGVLSESGGEPLWEGRVRIAGTKDYYFD